MNIFRRQIKCYTETLDRIMESDERWVVSICAKIVDSESDFYLRLRNILIRNGIIARVMVDKSMK